jgi:hypothetical protein
MLHSGLLGIMYSFYLLVDSLFMGIVIDIAWFSYSLYGLVVDRYNGHWSMEAVDAGKEDEWGFGQLVPSFLCFSR